MEFIILHNYLLHVSYFFFVKKCILLSIALNRYRLQYEKYLLVAYKYLICRYDNELKDQWPFSHVASLTMDLTERMLPLKICIALQQWVQILGWLVGTYIQATCAQGQMHFSLPSLLETSRMAHAFTRLDLYELYIYQCFLLNLKFGITFILFIT
jgi:hypothetical protein